MYTFMEEEGCLSGHCHNNYIESSMFRRGLPQRTVAGGQVTRNICDPHALLMGSPKATG